MSDATTIDARRHVPPGGAGPPRAYLLVRSGATHQVIHVDVGNELVLGRASTATVHLEDANASREHARVRRDERGVHIADLESRNGTLVNGERLRGERLLRSGDLVRIGEIEILFAESASSSGGAAGGKAEPALAPLPGVVVADTAMVEVFQLVRKLAAVPTTVLILGETGVGKEVVAEQIHRQSGRAKGPFVRLNCGSLPETLLESELFGHERGAFTGANERKVGYLEAADGGTLFLDEIGELAPAMQTKLLRVLENRRVMRIGGREEIAVDVRLIAATNRDLEAEVKTGRFRSDLYFRISTFVLSVPPLRQRPIEVGLLAELFMRQFAQRAGGAPPRLRLEALTALQSHRWPGNVRELRNAIERAVVLAEGGEIGVGELPEAVRRSEVEPAPGGPMRDELADLEQRRIEEALAAEEGNQTRAAKRLGISRRALIYKLEKYKLR